MSVARDQQKQRAAEAALSMISANTAIGVGSGSTAECFAALLPQARGKISRLRASSERTAKILAAAGFACDDSCDELDLYVDGADEIDSNMQMVKGGGGAHTREKVLACCARRFVCIVDESKVVPRLGRFPLAVEVLPMARSYAARRLAGMGGSPRWREGFVSDNGNWILDVSGLDLSDAARMEERINAIAGVMDNGIFARRRADCAIVGGDSGAREL